MPDTLDYASPEQTPVGWRKLGWTACIVSCVFSLWTAIGSIQFAYDVRYVPMNGNNYMRGSLFPIGNTILVFIATVGLCVSWLNETGARYALAALFDRGGLLDHHREILGVTTGASRARARRKLHVDD
jgi:hypothetical protein